MYVLPRWNYRAYLYSQIATDYNSIADLDHDGNVNVLDVIQLMNIILEL